MSTCVCPRCEYDLSGAKPPDDGALTCPECGLTTAWADIIDPRRVVDRYDIENPLGSFIPSFLLTFLRTFLPPWIWTRSKLEVPVRPIRLAIFAVLVLLFAVALVGASIGVATWRLELRNRQVTIPAIARGLIPAPRAFPAPSSSDLDDLDRTLSPSVAVSARMNGGWLTQGPMQWTVRTWAAGRGLSVSASEEAAWAGSVVASEGALIQEFERAVRRAAWERGLRAALSPLAATRSSVLQTHSGRTIVLAVVLALAAIIMPATLLLLSRTLRTAKVSVIHLTRGAVFTAAPAACAVASVFVLMSLSIASDLGDLSWPPAAWISGSIPVLFAISVLWFVWTWTGFFRWYLRTPRAFTTAGLLAILSVLLAALCSTVLLDRQALLRALFPDLA